MCTEFWCGWFDHWGERHHTRDAAEVLRDVDAMLAMGASFNLYMFCGGTNFGFTAGANQTLRYSPTVTSYDYCAPLTEHGDYTPLYYALRERMCAHQGQTPPPLPPRPRCQAIGPVELTETAGLLENLAVLGREHHSPTPGSMEDYGQSFGLILYETVLPGPTDGGRLTLQGLRDRAHVFLDGRLLDILDISCPRGKLEQLKPKNQVRIPKCPGGTKISVLVEAMGRVNYGPGLADRKGISALLLGNQSLMNFTVTTLPLDDLSGLSFGDGPCPYPKFFRGRFRAERRDECFVRLTGFTKGVVYVNGFNLGRYWSRGPQKTLYLPGALLRLDDFNEIVVLELVNSTKASVTLTDTPDLG